MFEPDIDEADVWQVRNYNGDTVELHQRVSGRDAGARTVPVDVLLEKWRLHNKPVTELLAGYNFNYKTGSPTASVTWKHDYSLAAVSIAMRSVFTKM